MVHFQVLRGIWYTKECTEPPDSSHDGFGPDKLTLFNGSVKKKGKKKTLVGDFFLHDLQPNNATSYGDQNMICE